MYNVEYRECGVWWSAFTTANFLEACHEASFLTFAIREEWIRILD